MSSTTGNRRTHVTPTSVCPLCQSTATDFLPREERPDRFFLRSPRQCRSCGLSYVPASNRSVRWLGGVTALGLCIGICFTYILPSLTDLIAARFSVRAVLKLIIGFVSIPFFFNIVYNAARGGRTIMLLSQNRRGAPGD
jgi:hypothetical protein